MSIPEPSAIGIDLGTTNCCVAVFRNGRCEAVPSGNGSTTIPSYVAFEDDHCVVGQEAKDNAFGHPKGTIFAVKRILGHRYSEVEDGVRLSQRWPFALTADENGFAAVKLPDDCGMTKVIWKPEEVSGELLKHLKELAQDFLGCPVQRAVITVPASFTEHQRRCTLAAGVMAGLEVVGIVNEPTAAAIAYGLQTPAGENEKTRIILVCDFGGGTIDVSIISAVGRSTFQVLGTSGNMHLGGEDFDDCLVEELLLRWEELHGPGIRQSPAAMTRLRKQAQQVKHTLATGTEENAGVVLASLFGGVDFRTTVSRTTFEKVCGHLFQQALEPIETAMRLTNMRKQDLSHIVLVGGSSRMRVFRDMVADYFPDQRIFKDIHPDEAIAIGAGLMAQNAGELTVADVIALDLGTEVWGGGMTVILPRFSKVPSSAEKVFTTTVDFQTRISVMVYEGTDPVAKNNRFWGRLLMTGIQPALAGFPKIAVTYEYDHFGILKVSAKDLATDSTVETSINLNVPNGS